jgi:hypothetical protein
MTFFRLFTDWETTCSTFLSIFSFTGFIQRHTLAKIILKFCLLVELTIALLACLLDFRVASYVDFEFVVSCGSMFLFERNSK